MAETADHLPGNPPTAGAATARLPWYRVLGRATSRLWVGCAVALIATAAAVAGLQPWSLAAAYTVMLVVAILAAIVDAIELRLPDSMTYPILAAGILTMGVLEITGTHQGPYFLPRLDRGWRVGCVRPAALLCSTGRVA